MKLFVCTGAIYRSPAAAVLWQRLTGEVAFASAVSETQRGKPIAAKMRAALTEAGCELPLGYASTPVGERELKGVEIWCMQPSHVIAVRRLVKKPAYVLANLVGLAKIPDPCFMADPDACRKTIELLIRCLERLRDRDHKEARI